MVSYWTQPNMIFWLGAGVGAGTVSVQVGKPALTVEKVAGPTCGGGGGSGVTTEHCVWVIVAPVLVLISHALPVYPELHSHIWSANISRQLPPTVQQANDDGGDKQLLMGSY